MAVEFALVGLPFVMLICGIMALGCVLYTAVKLDYATQRGARQVMVGATQKTNLTADQFRTTVICPFLPVPMFDCAKVIVNLTSITPSGPPTAYYKFVKNDRSGLILPPLDNTKTGYCTANGNMFQVLQVLYPMPVYLGLLTPSARIVDGKYVLLSTAVFKNEPFSGATTAPQTC